jgi:hypothetical protein
VRGGSYVHMGAAGAHKEGGREGEGFRAHRVGCCAGRGWRIMQSCQALHTGDLCGLQTAPSWTTEGHLTSGWSAFHYPDCRLECMCWPHGVPAAHKKCSVFDISTGLLL